MRKAGYNILQYNYAVTFLFINADILQSIQWSMEPFIMNTRQSPKDVSRIPYNVFIPTMILTASDMSMCKLVVPSVGNAADPVE